MLILIKMIVKCNQYIVFEIMQIQQQYGNVNATIINVVPCLFGNNSINNNGRTMMVMNQMDMNC